MRILTAEEIRLAEAQCFRQYATEAELMLRAGTACFAAMTAKYPMKHQRVAVYCGNGKNAGDGFVIARLLYAYGADVRIVLCDKTPELPEPLLYFEQAKASGVPVVSFADSRGEKPAYIVDCIFGIGFHGEPRAPFDAVFEAVNAAGATVISVDTPSGTDATTGAACRNAVRADFTVAVSVLKYAHILPPGNALCGDITAVDIGIPADCYPPETVQTIETEEIRRLLVPRDKNAHKGSVGHQLNICGSYRMFGAAVIAAKAALRGGAGLLKLTVPESAYPLIAAHLTQPVFNPVFGNEEGTLSEKALFGIIRELPWADSIVLGCGLGCNEDTKAITEGVLKNAECPVVLDADGINAVKERISIIRDVKVPVVLTPHPGEMAGLISSQVAEIQENRITIAQTFARENKVILVLKGANTVVTDGETVFVNMTGNSGMAMGGSGDMLSGLIGAFIAQGMRPFDAAKAGVFLHGLSGDRAAARCGQRGMLVDDMTEQLGVLMSEFEM